MCSALKINADKCDASYTYIYVYTYIVYPVNMNDMRITFLWKVLFICIYVCVDIYVCIESKVYGVRESVDDVMLEDIVDLPVSTAGGFLVRRETGWCWSFLAST